MSIIVTTTGSFPPRYDSIKKSIKYLIEKQIQAGTDILVDGQLRSDIVGMFAKEIGLEGDGLPYLVRSKIGKLAESVTLPDLRIAAKYRNGHPLKAHITGPTILAENCQFDDDVPIIYRGENGYNSLVLDIAGVLAQEAKFIAIEAEELGIEYLQIDEPSFVFGADLNLANRALEIISTAWRKATSGPIILHVCGDYREIFIDLLKMPVDILNIEIEHFQELDDYHIHALQSSEKKISFGVIPVNSNYIPSPERVARDLLYAADRCGMELLWGITPVCGMRLSQLDLAEKRIKTLVQAVSVLGMARRESMEAKNA